MLLKIGKIQSIPLNYYKDSRTKKFELLSMYDAVEDLKLEEINESHFALEY